jgi:diacylglycerol O-acyltransferase / wax synthase
MTMSRRPIGAVDTIWLNMDRPENLMVVESLITFDDPVDWDRLLDVVNRRLLDRYPVFSQRPVLSPLRLTAHWEDDPDFDVARHVERFMLPDPGDDEALQRYVGEHMSVPLPRDRPLWAIHLIDGYRGGAAVYTRLHHALADGLALAEVLLSLTDADTAGPEKAQRAPAIPRRDGLVGNAARALLAASAAAGQLPGQLHLHRVVDAVDTVQQAGRVAGKLLFTPRPTGPLTGGPTDAKLATWSQPLPLADLRALGRRTGTTLNDVLLAALAGAVSAYQRDHGVPPQDVTTMVPVNVRPAGEPLPPELGNRFALVLFRLPSGENTPFQRLAETHRRMAAIKRSPEALITFRTIQAIGRTGRQLERHLVDFFADKAIGVTTNVPGPREPRYLAGTRIRGVLGWAPESGDQTLGMCVFTYAGSVQVGFKVDALRIPQPEKLVYAFEQEVAELARLGGAER